MSTSLQHSIGRPLATTSGVLGAPGLETAARNLRAAALRRIARATWRNGRAMGGALRRRVAGWLKRWGGADRKAVSPPWLRAIDSSAKAVSRHPSPWRVGTPRLRRPGRGRKRLPVGALALALQGGGAHGAYTWGVLDRLLETPGFVPDALSGTSAGAMNAVALAAGWVENGPLGAKMKLRRLWHGVVETARLAPGRHGGAFPRIAMDVAAHLFSPYQLNPLGLNPLADLLDELIDFASLDDPRAPRLLLAATDVARGDLHLFDNAGIDARAVLASACLPQLFHAVEIDGRAFWDGGYVSNPPILALIERARVREVLLVQINPLCSRGLPTNAGAIRSRAGEITFGRPLADELARFEALRSAPFARLDPGRRPFVRCRLEILDGSGDLEALPPATRLLPEAETILHLQQLGRAAAEAWLERRAGPIAPAPGRGRRAERSAA